MDQGQLDALYQQYLGRGVDPSGASTWANADYNTVVQGILGSQEYQNRNQSASNSAPVSGGGAPTDINSIYQQYLGRGVDPSGAATYAGWDPQSIINAVTSSQEYRNRTGGTSGAGQSAPAGGNPQDLANQVFNAYKTNQNYDQTLNQLNATPQNADYYRARIGLIGQMMGWQTGQNTGGRNTVYQQELASYLPGAKAAGLTDQEINNLISQNSAAASQQNQQRIASEAAQGQGWVNQNIPGGWATVGGLAALAAAPYLAPEIFGAGTAAEGAIPLSEITGSTFGGSAFTLPEGLGAAGGALGSGSAASYLEQLAATQAAEDAAYGAAFPAGTVPEGAGLFGNVYGATGLEALLAEAGLSGLSSGTVANLLKGGASLASIAKLLGGSSSSGQSQTASNSPLSTALKNYNPYAATASGTQLPTNFSLAKGNVNPFVYGKDVPTQTIAQSKADPFAALNVAQTPVQPFNPLAHLVG